MSLSSDGTVMTMPVQPANTTSGNGWGFGGDGAWWIIILFLFVFCGWGGNWGGNNAGNGAGVVDGYVLTSDFASIERKIDNVNNGLCDGFYQQAQLINGVQQGMSNGFMTAEISRANQQAAFMQQLNAMQMQQQNCCCETRQAISTGTRDIIDNQNGNTRAILDALTAQRIEAKDAKIAEQNQQLFAAQLAASQAAQNSYLIQQLRPTPIPAYSSCNPWAAGTYTGCGTGCGGCGC